MAYLNCAYMSPLSKRVQEAGAAAIAAEGVPAGIESDAYFAGRERIRELFARVAGIPEAGRVAVIPSASYGLATVAHNTELAAGDNVVTAREQFPSNVLAWRRLCADNGGELRVVPRPDSADGAGGAWSDAIIGAIDERTRVVALGTVHWTDGTLFDLDHIGERARQVGAALVIDGTQSVGAAPFDFEAVQPDALICAGYKWLLGPYGLGAGYFGPRYGGGVPLEETWIARVGSEDFAGLIAPSDEYRPGSVRYDAGGLGSLILVPMLVAALEQLLEWGVPRISSYVRGLTDTLFADPRLEALGLGGRPDMGHIFGLRLVDGVDPGRVLAFLRERDVHVSIRGRTVRVSPQVYNDEEDVAALVAGLVAALGRT